MFEYLKSLEDINVDLNDDMSVYEKVAEVFDSKLFEYNCIMKEIRTNSAETDRHILAAGLEIEGLNDQIDIKE